MTGSRTVAVVGGGASGLLTALHLLRSDRAPELTVQLYDAGVNGGVGVAYSTTDPRHLLNVPASNMTALPDRPDDLLDWTAESGERAEPLTFLPRRDYGRYLRERLAAVASGRLQQIRAEVTDVEPAGNGHLVHADTVRPAGVVVLAYGNLAPRPLGDADGPLGEVAWHLPDPWRPGSFDGQYEDATVLVVGSGLTAVDVAVTLLGDSDQRRVVMLSRHGLLPYRHAGRSLEKWPCPIPSTGPLTADALAQIVVDQIAFAGAQGVDWRSVIDGLRSDTQHLWSLLDTDERRRFLHTYARSWEVRRHRMAPPIAERLDSWRRTGRLELVAGTVSSAIDDPDNDHGAQVRISSYPVIDEPFHVCAVVNCTGPQTDIRQAGTPLFDNLLKRGLITPDELGIGIETDPHGAVRDAAHAVVPGLFAIGPPRKGMLYESTAVPEIRQQAAALAAHLHP